MKKKIAKLLLKWSRKLNPDIIFDDIPEARQMGITLHITKKDVRNWRKNNPECKSHRQGLQALIEEAKWRVAGAIGRGLMKNKTIHFDVKKTLYVADVSGSIFVYAEKEDTCDCQAEGTEEV